MEAVSMVAVADVIGSHMYPPVELYLETKNGEEHHAAQNFTLCST
jgi:hypothetical protein